MVFLRRVLVLSVVVIAIAAPAYAYVAPVNGKVVDHFRPPANKYSAGNRGIDYNVASGTSVIASESGIVTFAGQVGGELFVVITHSDGLRTTYGYLQQIKVSLWQRVAIGEQIAIANRNMHFGVRDRDQYIDPQKLLNASSSAHLIPVK